MTTDSIVYLDYAPSPLEDTDADLPFVAPSLVTAPLDVGPLVKSKD